jgi:hypothetical protein
MQNPNAEIDKVLHRCVAPRHFAFLYLPARSRVRDTVRRRQIQARGDE